MNRIFYMVLGTFFLSGIGNALVHSEEKILKIQCNGFLGDCTSIPTNMCGEIGYTMVDYNIVEYTVSDKTSSPDKNPTNKIVYDIFFKCNK